MTTTIAFPSRYRLYSLQAAVAQAYATIRRHLYGIVLASYGHAPLPGDLHISSAWIRRTLVTSKAIPSDAIILSVEPKGLDGNRGLAGIMTRIHVFYKTNKDQEQQQELHLILKKSGDGRLKRLANIINGQAREALFYGSSLAGLRMPSTILPKVYYAHGSHWLGEYIILMEDIKARGSPTSPFSPNNLTGAKPVDINFVFGNQIWGIPAPISPAPPSQEIMLESMFLAAADFHAVHWNDPQLLDGRATPEGSWLKASKWYHGQDRARWEWAVEAGRQGWIAGKAKATGGGDSQVNFSAKFVDIMDKTFANASWDNLQTRLKDKSVPFTLSHGDFHAANMILDRSRTLASEDPMDLKNSIALYDWSEVGVWEPTTDLGQTVISDVPIKVFQQHAKIALRKYYDRVVSMGAVQNPKEYTFEVCWSHFLRGGVEKWIWVLAILSSFPGMPGNAIQYFHDQMMAFIELDDGGKEYYDMTTVICFAPPPSK